MISKIPSYDYTQPEYKKCLECKKYLSPDKVNFAQLKFCSKKCERRFKTESEFLAEVNLLSKTGSK